MTDVSGFGLSGHLTEMLQNSKLSATIEKLPIIKLTKELAYDFGYKFDECEMPETAGGMLISVDQKQAEELSERLSKFGISNWIIGSVDNNHRARYVHVSSDIEHFEITRF
jgi:selenophosphate synthase